VKKFKFELEKILEFRDFEKKQAEGELAKALAVESEIQDNLKEIANQYATLDKYMNGSLSFDDMISMSQNKNLLNYQKEELLNQLAEAKLVSEQKRKILAECMKKTTALEKMKELQLAQYKEEVKRAENKRLQEIAASKISSEISAST
jgi:flagellar FliJ protein